MPWITTQICKMSLMMKRGEKKRTTTQSHLLIWRMDQGILPGKSGERPSEMWWLNTCCASCILEDVSFPVAFILVVVSRLSIWRGWNMQQSYLFTCCKGSFWYFHYAKVCQLMWNSSSLTHTCQDISFLAVKWTSDNWENCNRLNNKSSSFFNNIGDVSTEKIRLKISPNAGQWRWNQVIYYIRVKRMISSSLSYIWWYFQPFSRNLSDNHNLSGAYIYTQTSRNCFLKLVPG